MKYLPLLWSNLMRRKARTAFTLLSVSVAFVLFCVLGAVRLAFSSGVEGAGADRLVVMSRYSLVRLLPLPHAGDIRGVDGVVDLSHQTWFGGIYQDPSNFFAQFAVHAESYLRIYPEIVLDPAERDAFLANRAGAIVGRSTAERFGWAVGDRIPIQGTIWRNQRGRTGTWEFVVEGIYDAGRAGFNDTTFYFHYEFLEEGVPGIAGFVGLFVARLGDPALSDEVSSAVDEEFAASSSPTRTSSESLFLRGLANQVGNIAAIVTAVLAAVFFSIVVVAAQTMVQALRERTAEFAVLKTLGFTGGQVLGLVLVESVILVGAGGALGLWVGAVLVDAGDPTGGYLPLFALPPGTLPFGAALVLAIGLLAGAVPCVAAMRLRIVDALRRV